MAASGVRGIDLFKIAGRSISGWIPNLKTGSPGHVRQPFSSHLEYHPQVSAMPGATSMSNLQHALAVSDVLITARFMQRAV